MLLNNRNNLQILKSKLLNDSDNIEDIYNKWYMLINVSIFIIKMKHINTHLLLDPKDIDISIEKLKTQRKTFRSSDLHEKKEKDAENEKTLHQFSLQLQLFDCMLIGNEKSKKYIINISKQNPEIINSKNYEGFTPLYVACLNGYYVIVELLIQLGADHLIKCGNDNDMQSVLEVVCRFGYTNILNLLLSKCSWPINEIKGLTMQKWDNREIVWLLKQYYNKCKKRINSCKCVCCC